MMAKTRESTDPFCSTFPWNRIQVKGQGEVKGQVDLTEQKAHAVLWTLGKRNEGKS